jgi:hypothetical protein
MRLVPAMRPNPASSRAAAGAPALSLLVSDKRARLRSFDGLRDASRGTTLERPLPDLLLLSGRSLSRSLETRCSLAFRVPHPDLVGHTDPSVLPCNVSHVLVGSVFLVLVLDLAGQRHASVAHADVNRPCGDLLVPRQGLKGGGAQLVALARPPPTGGHVQLIVHFVGALGPEGILAGRLTLASALTVPRSVTTPFSADTAISAMSGMRGSRIRLVITASASGQILKHSCLSGLQSSRCCRIGWSTAG